MVAEAVLPEGASPPLHVHRGLDDSFFVLDGRMVYRCGDETGLAGPGTWVPFPRGVPHTFRVLGGPVHVVLVHNDDSFVRFVREIGEPAAAVMLPPPTGGPGVDGLDRAMAGHDLANVGPPMEEPEAQRLLAELGA